MAWTATSSQSRRETVIRLRFDATATISRAGDATTKAKRLPTASRASSSRLPRVQLTRLQFDATALLCAGDATTTARRLPKAFQVTSRQSMRVLCTLWHFGATASLHAGETTTSAKPLPTAFRVTSSQSPQVMNTRLRFGATGASRVGGTTSTARRPPPASLGHSDTSTCKTKSFRACCNRKQVTFYCKIASHFPRRSEGCSALVRVPTGKRNVAIKKIDELSFTYFATSL